MNDTAKHTPTPWEVDICDKRNIRTRKKQLIASCCVAGSFPEANAALIVCAVNCHEELLAALKTAMMRRGNFTRSELEEFDRAIAKVEGQP